MKKFKQSHRQLESVRIINRDVIAKVVLILDQDEYVTELRLLKWKS